jgi:hypothetical protein
MWVSMKLETVLKIPSAPLGCSSHQRGKHSEKSLKLNNQKNVCEYREGKKESKHGRPLVCSTLNSKLESGIKLSPSLTRWGADTFLRCHVGMLKSCRARDRLIRTTDHALTATVTVAPFYTFYTRLFQGRTSHKCAALSDTVRQSGNQST